MDLCNAFISSKLVFMENMEHFLQDYYHKEILTHYTFTKISNTFSKLQPNNFIEELKIGKEILPLVSEKC